MKLLNLLVGEGFESPPYCGLINVYAIPVGRQPVTMTETLIWVGLWRSGGAVAQWQSSPDEGQVPGSNPGRARCSVVERRFDSGARRRLPPERVRSFS